MKWYFFLLLVIALTSIAGLALIIYSYDPAGAPTIIRLAFFVSISLLIWSLATYVRMFLYRRFQARELESVLVTSMVQALIVTVLIVGYLVIKKLTI